MVPTVAFRQPENLVSAFEILPEAITIDVDKFLIAFINDRSLNSGSGVDFDDLMTAKAALDEFEDEAFTVRAPLEVAELKGVINQLFSNVDGSVAGILMKDNRDRNIEFISRFRVFDCLVLGLNLVLRR